MNSPGPEYAETEVIFFDDVKNRALDHDYFVIGRQPRGGDGGEAVTTCAERGRRDVTIDLLPPLTRAAAWAYVNEKTVVQRAGERPTKPPCQLPAPVRSAQALRTEARPRQSTERKLSHQIHQTPDQVPVRHRQMRSESFSRRPSTRRPSPSLPREVAPAKGALARAAGRRLVDATHGPGHRTVDPYCWQQLRATSQSLRREQARPEPAAVPTSHRTLSRRQCRQGRQRELPPLNALTSAFGARHARRPNFLLNNHRLLANLRCISTTASQPDRASAAVRRVDVAVGVGWWGQGLKP